MLKCIKGTSQVQNSDGQKSLVVRIAVFKQFSQRHETVVSSLCATRKCCQTELIKCVIFSHSTLP